MNSFSLNETWLDLFERYYLKQMSDEETTDFLQNLNKNQDASKAYDAFVISKEVVEQKIEASLRAQIQEWQLKVTDRDQKENSKIIQLEKPQTTTKPVRWIRWVAAAAILFVVGFGYTKYMYVKEYADTLGRDYIEEITALQLRSPGESPEAPLFDILNKYHNDYTSAIKELDKIEPATGAVYSKAQQYIGRMYTRMGQCEPAANAFTKAGVVADADIDMSAVICLIKSHQTSTPMFETKLNKILSDPNHPNYTDAQKIKNDTKGIWWSLFN